MNNYTFLSWHCSQCDSIVMNKGEELKLPEVACFKCKSNAWLPYETKKPPTLIASRVDFRVM